MSIQEASELLLTMVDAASVPAGSPASHSASQLAVLHSSLIGENLLTAIPGKSPLLSLQFLPPMEKTGAGMEVTGTPWEEEDDESTAADGSEPDTQELGSGRSGLQPPAPRSESSPSLSPGNRLPPLPCAADVSAAASHHEGETGNYVTTSWTAAVWAEVACLQRSLEEGIDDWKRRNPQDATELKQLHGMELKSEEFKLAADRAEREEMELIGELRSTTGE